MAEARRRFLKAVAIAPVAAVVIPRPGACEPPAAAAPPAAPPPAGPAGADVAEALTEAVRREHGEHLSVPELAQVRQEIARRLDAAARLRRAARLQNGDDPVTVFHPAAGGSREGQR